MFVLFSETEKKEKKYARHFQLVETVVIFNQINDSEHADGWFVSFFFCVLCMFFFGGARVGALNKTLSEVVCQTKVKLKVKKSVLKT